MKQTVDIGSNYGLLVSPTRVFGWGLSWIEQNLDQSQPYGAKSVAIWNRMLFHKPAEDSLYTVMPTTFTF